jgi:hypothetical protein
MGTSNITGTGVKPSQKPLFIPNMGWTKNIPHRKLLNCVTVADETFTRAGRKLSLVERTGLDREKIRVAAFLPRVPGTDLDPGCRRYPSYMAKQFRQHGLDFRVEEPADSLELLLMGAQLNDKIFGTFVFFPTPFGKAEDYFLRRVRPEKDVEGLTVENTGAWRSISGPWMRKRSMKAVVPCTARAILTLLHRHDSIKNMFPRDAGQTGPTAVIFNRSPRIGMPLQSMLMRIGATAAMVHPQMRPRTNYTSSRSPISWSPRSQHAARRTSSGRSSPAPS